MNRPTGAGKNPISLLPFAAQSRRSGAFGLACLALLCCADPRNPTGTEGTAGNCEHGTVQQPVVGGSLHSQLFPLTPAESRAIAVISLPSLEQGGERALCTGVIVGARAV